MLTLTLDSLSKLLIDSIDHRLALEQKGSYFRHHSKASRLAPQSPIEGRI